MSKPRKPFMIEHLMKRGNCFAVVYKTMTPGFYQHVDWVDWDGTKFGSREDAEAAIRTCGYKSAHVIEVLDEIRTIVWRN